MKRFCTLAHLLRYGPAVLVATLIPVLSPLPSRLFHHIEEPLPPIPALDKIVHALMYAALTAACLHAAALPQRQRLATALLVALGAAGYGAVMEIGQKALTSTRSMDPLDALANAVGALACALAVFAVARRHKPTP